VVDPVDLYIAASSNATDLQEISDPHARGIIHLSYYEIFHLMAKKLHQKTQGVDAVKHGDLGRLLRCTSDLDPAVQEGRKIFSRLKTLRFRADYDLESEITQDDAFDALDWAEKVFSAQEQSNIAV